MKLEKITRDFIKTLTEPQKKRTTAYDSKGIVTRIEDGIAWVKLAGSKIETPLQMTISADPGDEVQVRIGNGTGWLTGNGTAPPTDDTAARISYRAAKRADDKAAKAQNAAGDAADAAAGAQSSANNASEYASRALGNLSTVQSVAETLAWITQHGTMTLTSDTAPVPAHVYFILDANGDYTVNSVKYSIVTEPDPDNMPSYYELTIDESLNNYVGTHLSLTGEGLWLLPESSGAYKVLIATGSGSVYTTPGTYIIDSSGNIVAKFGTSVTIGGGPYSIVIDNQSMKLQLVDNYGEGDLITLTGTGTTFDWGSYHAVVGLGQGTSGPRVEASKVGSLHGDLSNIRLVYDDNGSSDYTDLRLYRDSFYGKPMMSFSGGKMTVDGSGNMYIAGTLTQGSDRRLKEHIDYLGEDAAEFIRKLKPAHFIKDEKDHVGFYAQDVAVADPWKCMTGKMNGYMTLSYTELIAPLVAYCQSLEERIERLEKGE